MPPDHGHPGGRTWPIRPIEPDPAAVERLRRPHSDPGHRWLSVGRLAPNKAHHHTIAALFVAPG
jgi:hypothetical protein